MENRILIVAPRGRDAQVIASLLTQHGLANRICETGDELIRELKVSASSAILTEEALEPSTLDALSEWLSDQPVWSDFPFIVLTSQRTRLKSALLTQWVSALGNAVLAERPISGDALVSTARSRLRERKRQYQVRGLLAEKQQAADRLIEADRRKDQFLAMLAHELRNPLAPIRSAAEVLKQLEAEAPARVRWARQLIERQSRHLTSLLEDLLDISRITTGKVTLKNVELELNGLIARAVESAQSAIDARHHRLTVSMPDDAVIVLGDPVRLAQVIGNLLDNATKYTPPGGAIDITVTRDVGTTNVGRIDRIGDVSDVSDVADDEIDPITDSNATAIAGAKADSDTSSVTGRVVIAISDNGVGISPEDMPHVFELFNQASRALDRAQGGLGIGLSLVRSIVNMHGGTVEALSGGQGTGTCVRTVLPLLRIEPRRHAATIDDHSATTQPLDIVVIDDNSDSAESLAMLLTLRGHRVRTAIDGPSGLATCQLRCPDVVLLDIGLPGMDGYEVAQRIRNAVGHQQPLKLVALTGYGQPEDVRKSREAGFDHHLVKPVEPAVLVALLETHATTPGHVSPSH